MRRKLLNFRRSGTPDHETPDHERAVETGRPIDVTDGGVDAYDVQPEEEVVEIASAFDTVLSQELLAPSVELADPPPAPSAAQPVADLFEDAPTQAQVLTSQYVQAPAVDGSTVEPLVEHDQLRLEMATKNEMSVDGLFDAPPRCLAPTTGFTELGFWDRYDEAIASAQLFAVPPAAITAIVGSLSVAIPVAERCRSAHWVSDCDVYVLTNRPERIEDRSWKLLERPSEVVALLEDGLSDFPLIVVDVPRDLPTWMRPLLSRIRTGGVGLVRYVLDDDPSDEDLATWHGELGRPSVLDLAATVPPARVLDLLDRGEPVASVGGMPITADLLMALRLST